MRVFSVHSKPEAGPEALEAVAERFFWTAFLFTPFWAAITRVWRLLLVWILGISAIWGISLVAGSGVVAPLYTLFALWCGFAAPQFRQAALGRRGYLAHGDLVAGSRVGAEAAYLARLYGGRG